MPSYYFPGISNTLIYTEKTLCFWLHILYFGVRKTKPNFMVKVLPNTITLDYLGSKLTVDKVELDNEVIYKINLPQPLFIKKAVDDKGRFCWEEEGAGRTPHASVLGELIDRRMYRSSFYYSLGFRV